MSQEQQNHESSKQDDQEVPAPNPGAPEGQERREKMSEDIDDLLDEIDNVLEANAEEFVQGYVQQGGQ
jgi:prokaryotic ubiquitin-like protein Pup